MAHLQVVDLPVHKNLIPEPAPKQGEFGGGIFHHYEVEGCSGCLRIQQLRMVRFHDESPALVVAAFDVYPNVPALLKGLKEPDLSSVDSTLRDGVQRELDLMAH